MGHQRSSSIQGLFSPYLLYFQSHQLPLQTAQGIKSSPKFPSTSQTLLSHPA